MSAALVQQKLQENGIFVREQWVNECVDHVTGTASVNTQRNKKTCY